jgi:rhodanese-related sulfurtransferase
MAEDRFVSLLDIQPDSLFDAHHLSGAVRAHGLRIPDLREVLPPAPETPIVVYNTDGVPPPPGEDLAQEAVRLGFQYVYWLEGGVLVWKARGYNLDGSRLFPRP